MWNPWTICATFATILISNVFNVPNFKNAYCAMLVIFLKSIPVELCYVYFVQFPFHFVTNAHLLQFALFASQQIITSQRLQHVTYVGHPCLNALRAVILPLVSHAQQDTQLTPPPTFVNVILLPTV